MKNKIKAGEIRADIQEEVVVWYDRKRVTIFALPWSFTRYRLTESTLFIEKGFFNREEESIQLYRIVDINYSQSLIGRMNNTGTLTVISNDQSAPTIELKSIKNAKTVKSLLTTMVEEVRKKHGVKTTEMVGAIDHDCDCDDDVDHSEDN